jgi:carboxypeptidase C (cathepsin A)
VKKNNIDRGYYASGHMVYIDQAQAAKYHADLAAFVRASVPGSGGTK